MATKKKSAKKKAVKQGATRKLSTADAKKLVKIDQLSRTVGAAVKSALARQDLSGIRGPIICGIIYRPDTGTFTPIFRPGR
jgi:hypothetical protein